MMENVTKPQVDLFTLITFWMGLLRIYAHSAHTHTNTHMHVERWTSLYGSAQWIKIAWCIWNDWGNKPTNCKPSTSYSIIILIIHGTHTHTHPYINKYVYRVHDSNPWVYLFIYNFVFAQGWTFVTVLKMLKMSKIKWCAKKIRSHKFPIAWEKP